MSYFSLGDTGSTKGLSTSPRLKYWSHRKCHIKTKAAWEPSPLGSCGEISICCLDPTPYTELTQTLFLGNHVDAVGRKSWMGKCCEILPSLHSVPLCPTVAHQVPLGPTMTQLSFPAKKPHSLYMAFADSYYRMLSQYRRPLQGEGRKAGRTRMSNGGNGDTYRPGGSIYPQGITFVGSVTHADRKPIWLPVGRAKAEGV